MIATATTAQTNQLIKADIDARIAARDQKEGDEYLEFLKIREAEREELRQWMNSSRF